MSRSYYVVVAEVGSIQSYIFGSNRLEENLGASYLVDAATSTWAFAALDGLNHNLNGEDFNDKRFEDDNLDAEVIYSGGGNFVAIFADLAQVKGFNRRLSAMVIERAAGIQLLVNIGGPFQWSDGDLQTRVHTVRQSMKSAQALRPASAPLMGLGVTADCRSTGLPAVGRDEHGYYSAEVGCKVAAANEATRRLEETISLTGPYRFTKELDKIGRSRDENSYIAVVHADGNGIGEWLREQVGEQTDNRRYIKAQRGASQTLSELSVKALQALIETVEVWMTRELNQSKNERAVTFSKENGTWILPIRPIVFGGDDLTLVCDGRLGVSLATNYLSKFESISGLTASAGVAIVKSHYPFVRAYALSEELIGEAKSFRRAKGFKGSSLDWHIATSGLSGHLSSIRQREYRGLTARPLSLTDDVGGRTWGNIQKASSGFQNDGDWGEQRSKAKALRDALREGAPAVDRFKTLFGVELPRLDSLNYQDAVGRGAYFDALELLDFYVQI